jgi:WD40 repeat protein
VQRRYEGGVEDVAFSPNGTQVVTASMDGNRLWNATSCVELDRLAHGRAVNTAVFSPDGARVVTASDDRTGRLLAA